MCFDRGSLLADSPPTSHFARRTFVGGRAHRGSSAHEPDAHAPRPVQQRAGGSSNRWAGATGHTLHRTQHRCAHIVQGAATQRATTQGTWWGASTRWGGPRSPAPRAPVARSRAVLDAASCAHHAAPRAFTPRLPRAACPSASRFMVHTSCIHTSCHVVCVMLRMSCCMRRASHGAIFMAAAGGGAVPAQRGARTQCLTHAPGAVGELGQGRTVG